MICHICKRSEPVPTIDDPCCGAPDCENLLDMAHFECLSPYRQRQERED